MPNIKTPDVNTAFQMDKTFFGDVVLDAEECIPGNSYSFLMPGDAV